MNVCDTTRSHELLPSQRFAARAKFRRANRRIGVSLLLLAALCALAAAAFPRPATGQDAAIPDAPVAGLFWEAKS